MNTVSRTSSNLAIATGLGAVALFWALDILFENLFLFPDKTYLELLRNPEPAKLWVRLLASVVILLLVIQNTILLRHRENAEIKLSHSSFLLEERSIELSQKNENLRHEITLRKAIEKELQNLAVTDQLTGIFNRRKFDEMLTLEIRQESRYPRGLALLMLDIDHFKEVNDHQGHSVGDEVLKELSRLIGNTKRQADDFFRVGGEEFCLITFSTDDGRLETTAEKLRQAVADYPFAKAGHLTISIGAAHFKPGDNYDSLFKRADDALYQAKRTGRNKVIVA